MAVLLPPRFYMEIIVRSVIASVIVGTILFSLPGESFAQHRGWGWYEGMPYGHYCPGRKWGGPYGMRKPVKTPEEARQVMENYFAARKMPVTVGKIEERNWFFLAEIMDAKGTVVDEAIVDKRSGRIRSIY